MTRQWRGQTIDAEAFPPGNGWKAPDSAYAPPRPRSRRSRWVAGVGLPVLAAVMFGLGAFLGAPTHSLAQGGSWQAYAALPGATPPQDAMVTGAEDGLALYSCRATIASALLIGRYRSDFAGCHIGVGGKEIEVKPFELLGVQWQEGGEATGAGAVVAGETIPDLTRPAVTVAVSPCRASYQNSVHPGFVTANDRVCRFGFGGRVVSSERFSVLQAQPWLTWVPAVPQNLPDGTLIGGQEGGELLYVCRAPDAHGVLSGKLRKTSLGCSIASDGQEVVVKRFEVLVPRWSVSAEGGVPVSAVATGRDADGLLYLCRGQSRTMLEPGRLSETLRGCDVGMEGSEVVLRSYDVLTQ